VDSTAEALEQLLDATGESRAREILSWVARPSVLAEFERVAALRLVVRMRAAQEPRHVIRDRLALRGISRSAAYRIIDRALVAPPANCPTEGVAVGREPATVGASPITEPPEST
jgi:hypothetical protein